MTPFAGMVPAEIFRRQIDFSPYAGMTVGEVRLERLNVFDETDPRENRLLYRALNDIHYTSREWALRPQLLFASGETLDPQRIAESERNLRQNVYIADARVIPFQTCGRRLDLLVVTRDTWSLELSTSFSHTGGANNSGLTLRDTNILGTGDSIAVDYSKTPERESVDYSLTANNLFGSHVSSTVHYADTTDGLIKDFAVAQPFYALDTHWSAGASYYQEARTDTISAGGTTLNAFHHEIDKNQVFGAVSGGLQDHFSNRYYVGVSEENDLFTPIDASVHEVPPDRQLTYPWLAFERIEDRFAVYKNIDFINRTEDVSLGKHLYVKLGYGSRAFGNPVPQWRFSGTFSDVPGVGERYLMRFEAHADGAWLSDTASFENTVVGLSTSYHYLIDEKNRWYARLALDAGSGLTEDNLLTIGGVDDLRGYPRFFQRGDRRYVVNLERRYYSNVHILNLVRLGAVAFVDAGQVWQSGADSGIKPLYDAGVGLRLSSSKAHTGKVLHLDYAKPLQDQQNISRYQWLLKVQESF